MGRRSRKAAWLCSAVGVVAVVIVPGASGVAAESRASAVPAKLVGSWTRKVTRADVKRQHYVTDPFTGNIIGTVWTLAIKKSGDASLAGIRYYTGPVEPVGANRAHFWLGFYDPNMYKWHVSGRRLTLTKVSDSFTLRAAVLTGVWKRR